MLYLSKNNVRVFFLVVCALSAKQIQAAGGKCRRLSVMVFLASCRIFLLTTLEKNRVPTPLKCA